MVSPELLAAADPNRPDSVRRAFHQYLETFEREPQHLRALFFVLAFPPVWMFAVAMLLLPGIGSSDDAPITIAVKSGSLAALVAAAFLLGQRLPLAQSVRVRIWELQWKEWWFGEAATKRAEEALAAELNQHALQNENENERERLRGREKLLEHLVDVMTFERAERPGDTLFGRNEQIDRLTRELGNVRESLNKLDTKA